MDGQDQATGTKLQSKKMIRQEFEVIFWVVALCSLVEVYQHFRGSCCAIIMVITPLRGATTQKIAIFMNRQDGFSVNMSWKPPRSQSSSLSLVTILTELPLLLGLNWGPFEYTSTANSGNIKYINISGNG
jgi:hypothetical protein